MAMPFTVIVSMISRASHRRALDYRPLALSLGFEVLALLLRRPANSSLPLERNEYARRDRELFWYLLRDSVWEQYSKSVSFDSNRHKNLQL